MPAMELREVIEGMERAVEAGTARAVVRLRTEAELVGVAEVDVRVGAHQVTVDEPPSYGGGGAGPNPVQLALASLASCQAITYRFWAARLGIAVDEVRVRVEGDLDVRAFLGFPGAGRSAPTDVHCLVTVTGPEDPARYRQLADAVDEHCPVLNLFASPVNVHRELHGL
jgi:putative redox protein